MKKILLLFSVAIIITLTANSQWIELGGSNSMQAHSSILAVCSDKSGNIYAAGAFANGVNNSGYKYVAKFDGTFWSELGGTNSLAANNTINALCTDAQGNVYAAGDFTNSSGKRYVAKWNGTNWSEVGGLNALGANNSIRTICADGQGNIYGAGDFTNGVNNSGKRYVAKWDGNNWSEVGGLNALGANSYITSICVDKYGNLYAAGGFTNSFDYRYVAIYNLALGWRELSGGLPLNANNYIYTLCTDNNGYIYAAGAFTNAEGKLYVARYTTDWIDMGSISNFNGYGYINSICSDLYGNIYAGGFFTDATGSRYVAKYGGGLPGEVGSVGFNDEIYSVCADGAGNLYAGGLFTNNFGNKYVAKFANTQPAISIADKVMREGNTGTTTMKFTVSLNKASQNTITVRYNTADSTAKAGSDYTAKKGTLTFNAGETSKSIKISIIADTIAEPNEIFKILLSKPVNATLADSVALGTIRNDDTQPLIASENIAQQSIGNSVAFSVTVTPNPAINNTILHINAKDESCVTLTDLSGKIIWTKMHVQAGAIDIPLANIAAGIYIIAVKNGTRTKQVKLVKQ